MNPPAALPAPAAGSDSRLLAEIRRRIRQRGPLTFAEFMEIALYHPRWGYYARPADPVGSRREGDYYTAPSRHPAFGSLLGRQVSECLAQVGAGPLDLVEFGPGSGEMAASLLEEVLARDPGLEKRLRCTLVESNPHRVGEQRRCLEEAGFTGITRWLAPREWDRGTERVRGCLLANEVLDAMPVHRLIFRDGEFHEVYVGWSGGLLETLGPLSSPAVGEELERHGPSPREGQEFEVGMAAIRWIRNLASRLERGYTILVDYGHLAPEIYSPRHHRGTLLAYHRHHTSERFLERVGLQDLTAHVNFSSILSAARGAGLIAAGPVPQGRWLLALGILDRFPPARADFDWDEYRDRQALRDLFLPWGMGESHHVLVLATQGQEMDLRGLRPAGEWAVPPEPVVPGAAERRDG